jgi:hypothetical protein
VDGSVCFDLSAGSHGKITPGVGYRAVRQQRKEEAAPIDAVPGRPNKASEPKVVPLVSAENATARALTEVSPRRPFRDRMQEVLKTSALF